MFAYPLIAEASEKFQQAQAAMGARQPQRAEQLLIDALNIEPDNAVYRYSLGYIQYNLQKFVEAKKNFDLVRNSNLSAEKGDRYNSDLKKFKKAIRDLRQAFDKLGTLKFEAYKQNKNDPQKLKLAVTLYQAFLFNRAILAQNINLLNESIKIYEEALQPSLNGDQWYNEPMLQLAYFYELSGQKDKAAEIYMRALDYVKDLNEEFIVTSRFDYLNRSNKTKLIDMLKSDEFAPESIASLTAHLSIDMSKRDQEQLINAVSDFRSELENAITDEEQEQILLKYRSELTKRQESGELSKYKAEFESFSKDKAAQEKLKKELQQYTNADDSTVENFTKQFSKDLEQLKTDYLD
ncbi:MAG: hypothetical protein GX221_07660 [Candidatus Riflebacteria bacterium]|nr:hypothetical protein [Candidatus Riflebacteria bacterium]